MCQYNEHLAAQQWGLDFIRWHITTGQMWEIADRAGLVNRAHYGHLRDCWKGLNGETPNETCEQVRRLVDAIRRGEDIRYFYQGTLIELGFQHSPHLIEIWQHKQNREGRLSCPPLALK